MLIVFSVASAQVKVINGTSYLDKSKIKDDNVQKINLVLPEKPKDHSSMDRGAWSYVDRNREMDLGKKITKEGC